MHSHTVFLQQFGEVAVIHVCGNHQNINMSGVRSNNMERTWLIVSLEHVKPFSQRRLPIEPAIRRQLRLGGLLKCRKICSG